MATKGQPDDHLRCRPYTRKRISGHRTFKYNAHFAEKELQGVVQTTSTGSPLARLSGREPKGHLRAVEKTPLSVESRIASTEPGMVFEQDRSLHHPHDDLIMIKLQSPTLSGEYPTTSSAML